MQREINSYAAGRKSVGTMKEIFAISHLLVIEQNTNPYPTDLFRELIFANTMLSNQEHRTVIVACIYQSLPN